MWVCVSQQEVWPRGHRWAEMPAPAEVPDGHLSLLGSGHPGVQASLRPHCASLLLAGSGDSQPVKCPGQLLREPAWKLSGLGLVSGRITAGRSVHSWQTGRCPLPAASPRGWGHSCGALRGQVFKDPTLRNEVMSLRV